MNWFRPASAVLPIVLSFGCGGPPEPAEHPLAPGIRALVETALREGPSPGASVAVELDGEPVFADGFGLADLENDVPATADTVYRIGSVTKQFTAAATVLLVEDGTLDLDSDLREHFPDYDTAGFRIPVERLLNHTSGIKGYTEMEEFWAQSRLDLGHEAMLDLFGSAPFEFEPGDRYQYNNSGYYLLGVLIERLSGDSYTDFLRRRFFEPLGLESTHYLDNNPIVRSRAEGYELASDGGFRNDDPLSMRLPYAAGSLGSSVLDLLRWQRALVGGEAVSAAGYERMTAPGVLVSGEEAPYGYGLGLAEEHGFAKVSHGGGINGFRAQLAWYPEPRLGIAVLMNSGAGRPGVLENRIARHVLGQEQPRIEEVEVAPEVLEALAGVYDSGRSPLRVRFEDGSLHGLGGRLVPVEGGAFHPEGDPFTEVRFDPPAAPGEPAPGLTVTRAGNSTHSLRVEDPGAR